MSAYDQFLAETKTSKGTEGIVPPSIGDSKQPATPSISAYDRFKEETSVSPVVIPKAPQVKPVVAEKQGFLDWYDKNVVAKTNPALANVTSGLFNSLASMSEIPRDLLRYGAKAQKAILGFALSSPEKNLGEYAPDIFTKAKEKSDNFFDGIINAVDEAKKDPNTLPNKIQAYVKKGTEDLQRQYGVDPNDPTFVGQLEQGIGSMLSFVSLGGALSKGMKLLGTAERTAVIGGETVMTLTEASQERQGTYQQVLDETGDAQKAQEQADKTFYANLALIGVTNRFSRYLEQGRNAGQGFIGLLKDAFTSSASEGTQEGLQQVIQNSSTDKPIFEGVTDSALIGGILGAGTNLATRPFTEKEKAEYDKFKNQIIEENKNNPIVQQYAKGQTEEVDPNSAYAKFAKEKGIDLSKPAIDLQKEIEGAKTENKESTQIEGLDLNNKEKLTPEQAKPFVDIATQRYLTEKIQPEIDADRAVIIGGDDLKDYFGKDYNDNNHPVYSQSAFKLFEEALKKVKGDTVVFTSGGAGSGKTETIINTLRDSGFNGIIYDSNLSNYEGAVNQIEMAKNAGKKVEIYGILPNLEKARGFTIARENRTGRGISDATFARGHAQAPAVIAQLIENGKVNESDVKLLDIRKDRSWKKTMERVLNKDYVKDVVDTIKKLGYSEDNIKQTYAKDNFDRTTGQRSKTRTRAVSESDKSSVRDRSNDGKETKQKGDGARVPKTPKQEAVKAPKKKVQTKGKPSGKASVGDFIEDKKYRYTYNLNNPDDFQYLSRIFSEETMQDMKKGIFKSGRREGKETLEEIVNGYIVSEPYKKPKLVTKKYNGTRTFYHGTSPDNVDKIITEGFKTGASLPEDAFRSGGYGQMQKSVSLSSDPMLASRFTGLKSEGALLKVEVDPNAKIVSIPSIEDAVELNDYVSDLKKKGIDGVWIGGGEQELVLINPKVAKTVDSRLFKVQNAKEDLKGFNEDIPKTGTVGASIGRYREEGDIKLGNFDQIKPIEFPELVSLAKELSGNVPFIKKYTRANGMFYGKDGGYIGLNPDLFTKDNIGQLQKTLAHEIGHLIDYLPNNTMARGNLLGRLAVLRNFRDDFTSEAGATRTDKEVREELWNLSKYWKPVDEATASKSFLAYRKSAPEVYADFISVLFNNPKLASELAPASYNVFFRTLDKKPEVKKAYFELQDVLRNGYKVMLSRREKTRNMFTVADQVSKDRQVQIELEEEQKKRSLWFLFKFQNVSRFEAFRELVEKKKKAGEYINPDDNPVYFMEESNYLGGRIKAIVDERFNSIYQELQENGMSWDDLGEITFYERILKGDRGEVANPEGMQIDFVRDLYDGLQDGVPQDPTNSKEGSASMKAQLGEVRFERLKQLAVRYRQGIKDLYEDAYKEGLIPEKSWEMIKESEYYVPFKPIKYSGEKTSFRIKGKKGTLQPIENPANTGIEKAVSLIRAMEKNKVRQKAIKFLEENFPSDLIEARMMFDGKRKVFVEPSKTDAREKDLKLVTYMENGKVKGYYVDKYIGEALQKTPAGENHLIVEGLRFMNSGLYRPLFITYNTGFQSVNLIRDYWRSVKAYPDMSLVKSMAGVFKNYKKAFRASKVRAFGLSETPSIKDKEAYDLVNKLERDRIIGITYNDIIKGQDVEDAQIDRIMREVGVRKAEPTRIGLLGEKMGLTKQSPVIKQMIGIMEFIENTGNLIESMPKIAGYYYLEGKMPPAEMRSFIRRNVGSPDFLDGGRFKPVINEIFLFSNAIFQGIRADYEIAVNPKTRSGYWWKTAQVNFIPKLLMLMATYGLFGDYLKELFGDMSEYDKTNYTTVPLGKDENGKTIYFRIPQDETGRLLAGLMWKIGTIVEDPEKLADLETFTNLLSYAGGQAPSVTPSITALYNVSSFVSGQNPYDFFRGRPVLTDDQMLAGGAEKVKPFLAYMFDNLGGSVFVKLYQTQVVPKDPSLSERIVSLPVVSNNIGRFIKVSNYGQIEKLNEIKMEVRSENAREAIANRRIVFDYVGQARDLPYGEVQALKRKMILEILGKPPITKEERQKANSLEKRFDTLKLRGEPDIKIDALVSAQSNEERIALLQEFKRTLSEKEFNDLRMFIIKNKVVSSSAYQQFLTKEKVDINK